MKAVDLNVLWGTQKAQVFKNPKGLPLPKDVLKWALKIATQDEKLISTVMKDDGDMIYASRGAVSKEVRSSLIEAAQEGAPVQLQVNGLDEKVPELGKYFHSLLVPILEDRYPYGYQLIISLFITGPEHVYDAHNDLGDGILLQIYGKKRILGWGPQPNFFKQTFFNHDFREKTDLFGGERIEYVINAGEGIYFHRGMMHEISIPSDECSVSIGIRSEHVYPIVEVCKDLCKSISQPEAFTLPDELRHWSKFKATVFNPSRYATSSEKKEERVMPTELKQEFLRVVRSQTPELKNKLPSLLDGWWHDLSVRRNHSPTGVLPEQPENRGVLLQNMEKERLQGKKIKK